MARVLIYRHPTSITANAIGKEIPRSQVRVKTRLASKRFVVCYGQSHELGGLNASLVGNKMGEHDRLEGAGVNVPKFHRRKGDVGQFPVLGRRFQHTRGNDIVVINNQRELNADRSQFWSQYIDKHSEYRIHVLGEEVVSVAKKIKESDSADEFVWNRHRGWRQIEYNGMFKERLIAESIKAVRAVGYDFGAVDIVLDQSQSPYVPVVLEVNSAPSLNERRTVLYSDYFIAASQDKTGLYCRECGVRMTWHDRAGREMYGCSGCGYGAIGDE